MLDVLVSSTLFFFEYIYYMCIHDANMRVKVGRERNREQRKKEGRTKFQQYVDYIYYKRREKKIGLYIKLAYFRCCCCFAR